MTTEHFDTDHIHTTPEGRHFRHGDGVEVDGDGKPMWAAYLAARCKEDGVNLKMTQAELDGWCRAGVSDEDNADEVYAALLESLTDTE